MCDGQKHIICLVGGGGKTTIMYELAHFYASQSLKVLVLTSTHILRPAQYYAEDETAVQALWAQGSYAVIGMSEPASCKLTAPGSELYAELRREADIILCEADGAKHFPCKLPAAHEPVILAECDVVLAVCGADALARRLSEVCFRWQLGAVWLTAGDNIGNAVLAERLIDVELLARILTDERGARKNVGKREYYVVLNKCDTISDEQAHAVRRELIRRGLASEHIWLRGRCEEKE